MEQERIDVLLFAMVSLLLLCGIVVFLFWVFQNKKNYLLSKQEEEKKRFDKEIVDLQIEVREQTLRNISWELHDNIGQMLTLAKIQLQNIEQNPKLDEVKDTLGKALNEIRQLSKTTNPEFIRNINLVDALELEMGRFNRLNSIEAKLEIVGSKFKIPDEVELVLFRILQEFFSNTLKHSQANLLHVLVEFDSSQLKIKAKENGRGFDIQNVPKNGIGISNIEKRGKLINAEVRLHSELNQGSELSIIYRKKHSHEETQSSNNRRL